MGWFTPTEMKFSIQSLNVVVLAAV